MGDIEVARRFAIMHRVVTDLKDVIDLWSKRGAISGKGVLQQAIKTFLANTKRNGDFEQKDRKKKWSTLESHRLEHFMKVSAVNLRAQ